MISPHIHILLNTILMIGRLFTGELGSIFLQPFLLLTLPVILGHLIAQAFQESNEA